MNMLKTFSIFIPQFYFSRHKNIINEITNWIENYSRSNLI